MKPSRVLAVLIATAAILCARETTHAQQVRIIDRQHPIKAAFLYHFTRYMTWPDATFENAQTPFVIGVLGPNRIGGELDKIARAKTVNGRRIVIRRFGAAGDYTACQILFVSGGGDGALTEAIRKRADDAIKLTGGKPVLVVGENTGLERRGVAVNFFVDEQENRIKFYLHQDVLKQSGLSVSAQLLRLEKSDGLRILRNPK